MKLPGLDAYARNDFAKIPGWMHRIDLELFDRILAHQLDDDITGDVLEIGSYHGKSAIVLGYGLRDDELLTVCDLFGAEVDGVSTEGMEPYDGLTVDAFAKQYGRFHDDEPHIHVCASSQLALSIDFRFAHIDGGHAYRVVRDDIDLVRKTILRRGVVALDDYRSAHTPGVSAAVWEAAADGALYPFLLSDVKFYAATSRSDHRYWLDACRSFDLPREEHEIHGLDVVRMWLP